MRLTSLDVFRGITIAMMILVNMASLGDKVHPALSHADLFGWTFADLIFPFFLYIIGVAMAFSLAKYTSGEKKVDTKLYSRIIWRSLLLFILGIFLNGFWEYKWETLRWMGVLQRISIAYLISSLIILNFQRKTQWILSISILVGYWLLMALFPVPNYGAGVLTKVGNFSAFIDRLIIPAAHLYKPDGFNSLGDPEGVFSTIPASVNILFGYFTGNWLKKQKTSSETSIDLVMMGLSCLIIGGVWDFWFPISKKLWTSPYVIFTTGWALIALAMCYELVDVRQIRKWFKPMEIMGLNAIFAFVGSVVMIKLLVKIKLGSGSDALSIYGWINRQVFTPLFGSIDAGLIIGILMIILWWLICNLMYQKKLFLKI